MPPKIRELETQLKRAGFEKVAAKGSHRKWVHETGKLVVTSGHGGNDAKKYQIKDVEDAIASVEIASKS